LSYVDGHYDTEKDVIHIVERVNGERVLRQYEPDHSFYYIDPYGKFKSMFGDPLSKFTARTKTDLQAELRRIGKENTFEADLRPMNKCLSFHYRGAEAPDLHVAFFDIEVDFDKERGYAPTFDPFNRITAITVYLNWVQSCVTLVMPPKGMTSEEAAAIAGQFDNTFVFDDEKEMLKTFLDLIEDADVLSGWNSEGYDIPYTVNRVIKTLSRNDTRRFCLWDQLPKKRKFERFGAEQTTYDLIGRVHMDYMQLYRKFTYEERHSYSLDAIGEYELNERKTAYEGTLDQLYNNDWKTFIEYNRQDVMLMVRMDTKLGFMALANRLTHENTVLLSSVMGVVSVTEQAIINEAHDRGLIVMNRQSDEEVDDRMVFDDGESEQSGGSGDEELRFSKDQAAGAYVAHPKRGLHHWIGAVDLNSLYPSVLRALNMGNETLVGQLRPDYTNQMLNDRMKVSKRISFAGAWEGHFSTLEYGFVMEQDKAKPITVDWCDGTTQELSGAEIYNSVFKNENLVISANGTIFRLDIAAIVPGLLERWYSERKQLQATLNKFVSLKEDGIHSGVESLNITGADKTDIRNLDFSKLAKIIETKDTAELATFCETNGLKVVDGVIRPFGKDAIALAVEYWDKRQLVKKINLNSLYGALLNPGCRFFDHRIGQSTTLTGRSITKSMASTINETLTGKYDHTGDAIIYGDTDSCYFSAWPILKKEIESGELEWSPEVCIKLYDSVADEVNAAFPSFMATAFNCPEEKGRIIRAGREIVGSKGLFIKKKRYAILVIDKEGHRTDVNGKPGKIKAMGLDLKRADTPKFVQEFLSDVLEDVLTGEEKEDVIDKILEFKRGFRALDPWKKGSPKRVNNLTNYREKEARKGKASMPGHVRASLNWNTLRGMSNDRHAMGIVDGMKVVVCKLKPNLMGWTSIAYPTDELRLPKWFTDLTFDDDGMETSVVDQKVENLLGVLDWDIKDRITGSESFRDLFSFD